MKRLLMALVVAGLLGALSAPAAMATTTRIPTIATTGSSEIRDPGTWWYTGSGDQVEHVRGMVMLEMKNWNSPYALGPAHNTINWDLNLSTGRGAIWGSAVHYPTAFPGSEWHCSFRMPFDGTGGYGGRACARAQGSWRAGNGGSTWPWRRGAPPLPATSSAGRLS